MTKEFRLAVATKLPEDEFEQAAAVMACGKFKAEVIKLMETHKIVGTVGHEIVTPRGPNVTKPPIPAVPPTQSAPDAEKVPPPAPEPESQPHPLAATAPRHPRAA